jgi:hypothetical protein
MNFTRYWTGRWVRETRFSQYAANGLGVSRSQLTGLSNSLRRREVTSDASGETTETAASFDTQSGILVEISTTGAQTPAVRKKRHGRDVEIHDATGLYYLKRDPFGRPSMRRFDNGAFSGATHWTRRSSTTAATASSPPSVNTTPRRSSSSPSTTTSSGVRQAKLGASCGVQVPAEQVPAIHSYRVLALWKRSRIPMK